jgi:hypothetical protein
VSDGGDGDPADLARRERRKRNIALALALGGVAVLFFLMSIVQWHDHAGM